MDNNTLLGRIKPLSRHLTQTAIDDQWVGYSFVHLLHKKKLATSRQWKH